MSGLRRTLCLALLLAAGCDDLLPSGVDRIATRCLHPAPLDGRFDPRAPGYVVMYRDGTDAAAETWRLALRHRFRPGHVYTVLLGFSADLSVQALAGVRCEDSVRLVSHNGVGRPG